MWVGGSGKHIFLLAVSNGWLSQIYTTWPKVYGHPNKLCGCWTFQLYVTAEHVIPKPQAFSICWSQTLHQNLETGSRDLLHSATKALVRSNIDKCVYCIFHITYCLSKIFSLQKFHQWVPTLFKSVLFPLCYASFSIATHCKVHQPNFACLVY